VNPKRSTKNGPFCWQSKDARRQIRDAFDATRNVASALAVYDALTEIASDEQNETFVTAHAWIARMSGVSVRTIQNHLKVLAELKIVAIKTPGLRAKSTYTLLPFCNGCATISNHDRTIGDSQIQATLPRYEESKKNQQKMRKNLPAGPAAPSAVGEKSMPARSPLFDALAAACDGDPTKMTKSAIRACSVALAEIKQADPLVQSSDFSERAGRYRLKYPNAALTSSALRTHWHELGDSNGRGRPSPRQRLQEPHPQWQRVLKEYFDDPVVLKDEKNWQPGAWDRLSDSDQTSIMEAWNKIPEAQRLP
jgi:hypothetical protein